MPLIRIAVRAGRAVTDPDDDLDGTLDALPADAPLIVLIHGFKFAPGAKRHCPHRHILSLAPLRTPRAVSWPRHLGFGRGDPGEGLCLAFGWQAKGTIWQAGRAADGASDALAGLLATVAARCGRPVHLVAHSLGARVALGALPMLPEGTVGRMILLAAAETRSGAEAALASPAGRTAGFVNVRSGENALFDLLFRAALHPFRPLDRALGAGLGRDDPRWLDLAIDCPSTRLRLAAQGFRIPPPERRICHWSGYLRPGLFPLYRAILRRGLPLESLRVAPVAAPPPHPVRTALAAVRQAIQAMTSRRSPGAARERIDRHAPSR